MPIVTRSLPYPSSSTFQNPSENKYAAGCWPSQWITRSSKRCPRSVAASAAPKPTMEAWFAVTAAPSSRPVSCLGSRSPPRRASDAPYVAPWPSRHTGTSMCSRRVTARGASPASHRSTRLTWWLLVQHPALLCPAVSARDERPPPPRLIRRLCSVQCIHNCKAIKTCCVISAVSPLNQHAVGL